LKKRKAKAPEANPIPQAAKAEVIPTDLKHKWETVTAVATAFNTLEKGYFPHTYFTVLKQSLGFLAKLHETMVLDTSTHPQAHMIPELKELLKEIKKEDTQNGEEKAAN
jgi:hypothetical protein